MPRHSAAPSSLRINHALLSQGFAVVAPTSDGSQNYWNTNTPAYNANTEAALAAWNATDNADHALMLQLFGKMADADDADFGGEVSPRRLHAAGFSSGGYMASRAAFNYPGRFKSVVIASASWFFQARLLPPRPPPPAASRHHLHRRRRPQACNPAGQGYAITGDSDPCALPDDSLSKGSAAPAPMPAPHIHARCPGCCCLTLRPARRPLIARHPPALFLAGEKDDVVDATSQETYVSALEGAHVQARTVPDGPAAPRALPRCCAPPPCAPARRGARVRLPGW